MDPNRRDDQASQQRSADSDEVTNPSPTDARNPPRGPPLSESFQSTDTVRRRPENYGELPFN